MLILLWIAMNLVTLYWYDNSDTADAEDRMSTTMLVISFLACWNLFWFFYLVWSFW